MKTANLKMLLIAVGAYLCVASPALSQSLTKESLVKALKARGESRAAKIEEQQTDTSTKAIIDAIRKKKSRQISGEDRRNLAKVIEVEDRPSVDLVIYFDYNSAAITPKSMPTMITLGRALSDGGLEGATFLVAGHTDATGGDDYNLKLSQKRAESVRKFLIQNFKLDGENLLAVGYGEEQLKTPGQPDAAENRRVQVTNLAD